MRLTTGFDETLYYQVIHFLGMWPDDMTTTHCCLSSLSKCRTILHYKLNQLLLDALYLCFILGLIIFCKTLQTWEEKVRDLGWVRLRKEDGGVQWKADDAEKYTEG